MGQVKENMGLEPQTTAQNATPLAMLYRWEKEAANKVFLRQPIDGKYQDRTWAEVSVEIRKMAQHLKGLNFPPGSHIAVISKNCAHWIMADMAIWMSGHVSVPLYPNLNAQTVETILNHSESRLVFVGKLDKAEEILAGIPGQLPQIAFPYGTFPKATRWQDILQKEEPLSGSPDRALDALATIIYTSGTTGAPKGVMHTFGSFAFAGEEIVKEIKLDGSHRFFSYLPLAHVAERVLIEVVPLYAGASIAFAESLDTFVENLKEIEPTIFLGVPRIWEKFQKGILDKVPQKKLNLLLSLPIVSALIKRKLLKALGLSKTQIAVTGAAPTPVSLLEWYSKIGLNICEAYGLTENAAYSHFNRPGKQKFGTVGTAWPGVQVRFDEIGQLLMKSPSVMSGYYKDEGQTNEVLINGFFRTGDLGQLDDQGRLSITGRAKELFKTSKGKYVAPTPIELKLVSDPFIEQCCVTGQGLPQPMALIVLTDSARKESKEEVQKQLTAHLSQVNSTLESYEKIGKVVIVRETWTVENGLLTPTLKIKRHLVEQKYSPYFEKWQGTAGNPVWEN